MPIYDVRDVVPFVNELEEKIKNLEEGMSSWNDSRRHVERIIDKFPGVESRVTLALQRAEEAIGEIITASHSINANRGQRLNAIIEDLKDRINNIDVGSGEGGVGSSSQGDAGDKRVNDEVNNAVSQVDGLINDGLKLDYRLNNIERLAKIGGDLGDKDFYVPYKVDLNSIDDFHIQLEQEEGIEFLNATVTVLGENKEPIYIQSAIVEASISEDGILTFNRKTEEPVTLIFPVKMNFPDIPQDVLYLLIETVVHKNNDYLEQLNAIKEEQINIISEINAMKGIGWTADLTLVRNHKELIQESITPKGLQLNTVDDKAYIAFSYNDHEKLSHFEIEVWDEDKNDFVPYKTVYKE